jgi:multisubunit Na+/H+ antiporter MnhG subunit
LHVPPFIAAFLFLIGIVGLFRLDRDPDAQTSKALWIPTAWLMIMCSRPTSMWLGMSPSGGTANIYVEGSPIDAAVLMALVAAGLALVIARKDRIEPILRGNWPILLFFLFAAFSITWSDFPLVTFKHWVKGVGDVLMVLILLTEPNATDAIKRLVTRLGFVLLPLSVLFCKYYPEIGRAPTHSVGLNWRGVTMGKNILGGVCVVLGIALLWRFRKAYNDREDPRRQGKLVALGAVLGMTLWLLWRGNSMTSICVLAMASALMLLSGRPVFRSHPALVHLLVLVILGGTVYALFVQPTLVENLGRDPTLTGRTEIWAGVLSFPVSGLVGAGYESFWLGQRLDQIFARFPDMLISEAHNGYLEMFLNLGWIGVSLLAVIIISGYRGASAAFRKDPDMGGLCLAWLVAAAIRGQTEAAFRMLSNSWIFLLLAVMAASQLALPPDTQEPATDHDGFHEHQPHPEPAPVLLDRL